MSLITLDFRCNDCNEVEERRVKRAEAGDQTCECGGSMKRLMSAPRLDITGMAAAGCPGAHATVGDQLEKKHRAVDQYHRKAGS